jgi:hypothetical protein
MHKRELIPVLKLEITQVMLSGQVGLFSNCHEVLLLKKEAS